MILKTKQDYSEVIFAQRQQKKSLLLTVEVMVYGKKDKDRLLLPSVQEDDDAERESEKLQLGEVRKLTSQLCKLLSKASVNSKEGKWGLAKTVQRLIFVNLVITQNTRTL